MDPVTILQHAADTLGNSALTTIARHAIDEAWRSTVGVIRRRLGAAHPAPALVESLPAAANDKARSASIASALAPMQLDQDPDVMAAIEKLSAVIEEARLTLQGVGSVNAETINGAGAVFGNMTVHFGKSD